MKPARKGPTPIVDRDKPTAQDTADASIPQEAKDKLSPLECHSDIPKLLKDPICYDGVWINSWDLANPDFWDCGAKPLDIQSPICNHETGKWEKERHDADQDMATCGDVPITDDFVVCNYISKSWVKFQAPR